MNNLIKTILHLLIKVEQLDLVKLFEYSKELDNLINITNEIEDRWQGGWGQDDYDYYYDEQGYVTKQLSTNDIYNLIYKRIEHRTNIENLGDEINIQLMPFQSLHETVITELSIIRGKDCFKDEIELLNKMCDFKWGLPPQHFSQREVPTTVLPLSDAVLRQGMKYPPHIRVIASLLSLQSKIYSAEEFEYFHYVV